MDKEMWIFAKVRGFRSVGVREWKMQGKGVLEGAITRSLDVQVSN